ncbi:hypothetical protein BH10ACI4_BH10ACI4_28370 [soil metagenome]
MLYRLTFRKTDDNYLRVTARPDQRQAPYQTLVGDHTTQLSSMRHWEELA